MFCMLAATASKNRKKEASPGVVGIHRNSRDSMHPGHGQNIPGQGDSVHAAGESLNRVKFCRNRRSARANLRVPPGVVETPGIS